MRIGMISVYVNRGRTGKLSGGVLQSGLGTLIAAFIPKEHQIDIIDETCDRIDWQVSYDLLFISSFHSDFDRARQISHYWRRRGATTVYGGSLASNFPDICQPYFDAVVVGDVEGAVPLLLRNFFDGELQPRYISSPYDPLRVPTPRFDLVAQRRMVPLTLEATRGCPFSCEFCILTALGTRYQTRPVELVVRDIRAGQAQLDGIMPSWKRRIIWFIDNNIGGNPTYLRELCKALTPLKINWIALLTFNVLMIPGMIQMLANAGCGGVFVGLESFNPETLIDMHKIQNHIEQTGELIQQCLSSGIILASGILVSPRIDNIDYLSRLPNLLSKSGLYIPEYICFEAPFPGTPKFVRLANSPEPTLLPNALLRDFDAYTLVVRPRNNEPEEYVKAYRELKTKVFGLGNRVRKLRSDLPLLLRKKAWIPAAAEIFNMFYRRWSEHPARTFIAGTDLEPPEMRSIPFNEEDFQSEEERDKIINPWPVTDVHGSVLPIWRKHQQVFIRASRRR